MIESLVWAVHFAWATVLILATFWLIQRPFTWLLDRWLAWAGGKQAAKLERAARRHDCQDRCLGERPIPWAQWSDCLDACSEVYPE